MVLPDSDSEIEGGAVMMDEKRLEQEYRRLKGQQAPDLWSRIEGNLQEHPEREQRMGTNAKEVLQERHPEKIRLSRRRIYGMATAAAAMLALLVIAPGLMEGKLEKTSEQVQMPAVAKATEALPEEAPETVAEPEAMAAAGNAEPRADMAENGAGAPGENLLHAAPRATSEKASSKALPDGVLMSDQLLLASYQPITVPENAVTVADDSQYFSEDILRDAGLLCSGTVTAVSLERDASGKAVKVVYEMTLEQVYFAEDYTTGMEVITVKSPIVKTDGDEVYILYQLQPGGTYLLPLHKPEQDWELLYPFAPQIQVTGDGAYLFHSGYASLIDEDTSVVIGRPEGDNDYFYDRMVLRRDEDFLSELLQLVEH